MVFFDDKTLNVSLKEFLFGLYSLKLTKVNKNYKSFINIKPYIKNITNNINIIL